MLASQVALQGFGSKLHRLKVKVTQVKSLGYKGFCLGADGLASDFAT